MRKLIWILFVLSLPATALCQNFNYSRYDIKEGLAGSTVYCVAQDKEGFLWFGTETGLSRFDGTHFRNFFRQDGLTDNEVIQLYSDSKNRVWIAPFRKAVCYYYKGKIYNSNNDSTLKKLRINEYVVRFSEDRDGNMLLQEPGCLHLIERNGQVTKITELDGKPLGIVCAIASHKDGGFWVSINNKVLQYNNKQFAEKYRIPERTMHYSHGTFLDQQLVWQETAYDIRMAVTKKLINIEYPFVQFVNRLGEVSDSQLAVCTARGAFVFNVRQPEESDTLLPGKSVNSVFLDREGNYWMATKAEGIYRLNSPHVKTLETGMEANSRQVLCLTRYRQWVLAGTDISVINKFDPTTGRIQHPPVKLPDFGVEPVQFMLPFKDHRLVYATMQLLFTLKPDLQPAQVEAYRYVKSLFPYNEQEMLVATTTHVLLMGVDRLNVIDTIWRERGSAVLASGDTIYIGTLDGLFCRLPNKQVMNLANTYPVMANRILALAKDANNVLWIATSGEGLVGYKHGKIVAHLLVENGLTSNLCRCLFIDGNILWVGTDKGLNRINLAKPGYPVHKYTTGDGLVSDVINALYVENNKVFVATPDGITFFDEHKVSSESRCDLVFTDISIGGKPEQQWRQQPMTIPHEDNNLRFDYVGISFKSAGDVRYRYRLLGLDSNWKETRETFLSYPTLPSGEYELQLQAINKFEVTSRLLTVRFSISPLLWERTWFRVVAGVVFLMLTALLVWTMVRRVRKREEEKTAMNKRIGELEQLSRKAQMNPHFIFNSLNSIQQYVIDSDITGANKFISGFSRLIRQTLDFSSRKDISLAEELDYLSNYLELEKTRLENAFTWELTVDPGIHPADYHIPPMLMQPFVENSVRHGLRFRRDNKGKVSIFIKKGNDALVCVVEDNGIGRRAAIKLKSSSHIEYQSKGMSLTAERIDMWNRDHPAKITMQIEDLIDDVDNALGTRVTLTFPIL